MMSTRQVKIPGLWARRLDEDLVLELDVVEPEMLEADVAKRIHEADVVEGGMLMSMSMAISTDSLVDYKDRRVGDTLTNVAPMFSEMLNKVLLKTISMR